jgi:hypothetical protein
MENHRIVRLIFVCITVVHALTLLVMAIREFEAVWQKMIVG